jgi:hypothetical protein
MTVPQPQKAPRLRHRAGVALRALIAIFGGYALAATIAAALALWLPIARVEAVLTATMSGLIVYPCAIMWCFAARTPQRALGGLLLAALPFALLLAIGAQGASA